MVDFELFDLVFRTSNQELVSDSVLFSFSNMFSQGCVLTLQFHIVICQIFDLHLIELTWDKPRTQHCR